VVSSPVSADFQGYIALRNPQASATSATMNAARVRFHRLAPQVSQAN